MATKSKNFYFVSVNIFPEDDGCHNELLQSRAEGCVARVTPQIRLSVPPAKPLLFLQQGLLAPFYFFFFLVKMIDFQPFHHDISTSSCHITLFLQFLHVS